MSKYGYPRVGPNEIAREEPTLLRELVRVHVDDLGFADEELAALLALDLEDVRSRFLGELPEPEAPAPKTRLRLVE